MEDHISCHFEKSYIREIAKIKKRRIKTTSSVVSLAAVFSLVTQRSSPLLCGEERCVMRLKTAARETASSVVVT